MQMNQEKINFPVVRDFSELFNVSVKFVTQNFKLFFQSLLFIAGPFLLVGSICTAFYTAYLIDKTPVQQQLGFNYLFMLSRSLGWQYFLIALVEIFGRIILLTTAYAYIAAYDLYGPKNFGVPEVRKLVFQNIGKVIKGFFMVFLIILIFAFLVLAAIGIVASILPIINNLPLVTSFFVMLVFIVVFMVSPPFVWQFSTFYLLQIKEDMGVLDAMRRVRSVIRGEFFLTWIVIVASGFILSAMAIVFNAPQFIYQFISQMGGVKVTTDSIAFIAISTTCGFLTKFVFSPILIVNAFLYFSLDEKKYGTALIKRIDEIGNTPINDEDQQY